ncbi:MAG TPA: type I methionyl aminopeptidase [Bacteroidota bacterium]|nr:type I methionyl aminopeptidase [Bacteroidota bacterium]
MAKATIKSQQEVLLMKESCRIVAEVLRLLKLHIRPGVTTKELDTIAEEYIRSEGGEPAFKGYGSDRRNLFPASLCTSINEEVVHGIPGNRTLADGDIISVDVGVRKNGFYGDGAWTFAVGKISDEKERLMKITEESLLKGIEQARAGNHVHDISAAVQSHVEQAGFSVVRDLVGHGVGRNLHEEPAVPNYGEAGTGVVLQKGMTIAIEPMVNAGGHRVHVERDGWTVRTADGEPSAHFEHTVLVTEHQPEILTL